MDILKYFNIRYTELHFTIRFTDNGRLPKYKSSAIRGGLGEYLLNLNCVCPNLRYHEECDKCSFASACIARNVMYAKLKHKPASVTEESIGFTISCTNYKEDFKAGDCLEYKMLLFGDTITYLNPILQAFYAFGSAGGIGREHMRFEVVRVANIYGEPVLENGQVFVENYKIEKLADQVERRLQKTLQSQSQSQSQRYALELEQTGNLVLNSPLNRKSRLEFYTPLTLKYQNKIQKFFPPQAVLNAITRRIFLLNCMEGNAAPNIHFIIDEDISSSFQQKAAVVHVPRYSNRKNRKMVLTGIEGYLQLEQLEFPWQIKTEQDGEVSWSEVYEPIDIQAFLVAGSIVGIGKNTKFGFGWYNLDFS